MTLNILIIDKNKTDILSIESLIKDVECSIPLNIFKASSSHEALSIAASNGINLIIIDAQIDEMSCFKIVERVKGVSSTKEIPVIYLTESFDADEFIKNGYRSDNINYCIKPIEKYQLLNNIGLHLKLYVNKKELLEYKKALDFSTIISKADLQGRITYVNDKLCNISGYTREELLGKPHSILRSPNMPKEVFEDLWTTIQSKKNWEGVVENRAKNGSSYFVKASITPILNYKNEIEEYISIREDITELKKLQLDELSSSLNKALYIHWDDTVNLFPSPTVIIDENSKIKFSNNIFKSMFAFIEDNSLDSYFIVKDEYIFSDDVFDWKDIVLNSDDQEKVIMNIYGAEKEFYIDIKKIESDNLYTVCFHSIDEVV